MSNDTLLAVPFFTFMGIVLEKSRMAEELLDTVGQLFGPVRGGLAYAVVLVGAVLAATTGVVAASVISMGLISLPIMMRYGYNSRMASGTIAAAGSMAQVIPPSLVLIVMADQLGLSVGDMYAGALLPAALLIGLYAAWIITVALLRPGGVPAVPPAQPGTGAAGGGGQRSRAVLAALGAVAGWGVVQAYPALLRSIGRDAAPPPDEIVVVGLAAAVLSAFALALFDGGLRTHWLSPLARRVAFVMMPVLMLIFFVLGSIFIGLATPTESGAMGASAALLLAALRRRLRWRDTARALLDASKLACIVMFLMFGASVFSLSFQALEGIVWVESLLAGLPGGTVGFLVFVTLLVFVLGCFLDFFEIAIVLLPLIGPIAQKMGIDLVWLAVLIGINLQTSFLTPPFGFALFFLRGVAPAAERLDAPSGRWLPGVRTGDIYRGALPFVALQLLAMALVIAFPALVLGSLQRQPVLDEAAATRALHEMADRSPAPAALDPLAPLLESLRATGR
jgi:TRAP-type mannitol/chloroaromatic compound transport system permease large subunit